MITFGSGLLGIGLVIVSVLGTLSLAAGDQNTVAISREAFWLAVAAILAGMLFIAIGVWRQILAAREEDRRVGPREDWSRRQT